jgi:prolyl-tRNA synthetase
VVRPTSETIIWSMYKKWIQSYRDLPLLINQWANVLRWEKRTRLFLRTTEFLWQEGHTAHATDAEAQEETLRMLEVYRCFAEDWMAIPVLTGVKSQSEKFAGAVNTYAIEAMMQDRKALQAGTSHNLGQNFARAFDVTFQDKEGNLSLVWATSWGVSTRLIGALIMAHSDDKGLVLPPRLAPIQAVVIPIFRNDTKEQVIAYARSVHSALKPEFRVAIDTDDQSSPGWKFAEWELQGVPLRIEAGPKDMAARKVVLVRRDTGEKKPVDLDQLGPSVTALLADIQSNLFRKALDFRKNNTKPVTDYKDFVAWFAADQGFAESPWCGSGGCEAKIKEDTKATIRVIPFGWEARAEGSCIACGKPASAWAVFAKSY